MPTLPNIFRPVTRNTLFFMWPYLDLCIFFIVLQATIMGNPDFDEEAEQAIADRLKEAMDGCGRVLHLKRGSYCPASQE